MLRRDTEPSLASIGGADEELGVFTVTSKVVESRENKENCCQSGWLQEEPNFFSLDY